MADRHGKRPEPPDPGDSLAPDPGEPPRGPHLAPPTRAAKAARQARLAAELRSNLQKRKRQQRARDRGLPPDG